MTPSSISGGGPAPTAATEYTEPPTPEGRPGDLPERTQGASASSVLGRHRRSGSADAGNRPPQKRLCPQPAQTAAAPLPSLPRTPHTASPAIPHLPNEVMSLILGQLTADADLSEVLTWSLLSRGWCDELGDERSGLRPLALFQAAFRRRMASGGGASVVSTTAHLAPHAMKWPHENDPPRGFPMSIGHLPEAVKQDGLEELARSALRMPTTKTPALRRTLVSASEQVAAALSAKAHRLEGEAKEDRDNVQLRGQAAVAAHIARQRSAGIDALRRTLPGQPRLRVEDQRLIEEFVASRPARPSSRADPLQTTLAAVAMFLDRFTPPGLPRTLEGFARGTDDDIDRLIVAYHAVEKRRSRRSGDQVRTALQAVQEMRRASTAAPIAPEAGRVRNN